MFDFYKSFEANQKLAREVATEVATAAIEFGKIVTDANAKVASTVTEQITAAYKSVPVTFPSLDAFTKTAKTAKSAE